MLLRQDDAAIFWIWTNLQNKTFLIDLFHDGHVGTAFTKSFSQHQTY